MTWIDAIGWLGAVLLLAAYVLVATRKLEGHSAAFHGLNLLGGAGLATNSAANGAFPSVALNVIWMLVGVVVLLRPGRNVAADGRVERPTDVEDRPA